MVFTIADTLGELIFKIYEKIEELDSKHVFAGSINDFEYSYGLKILKSLLDNKDEYECDGNCGNQCSAHQDYSWLK